MRMPRPSDAQKEAFRALVPEAGDVEVRPMFGQLAAFVAGNMFMALYGDQVTFKLDETSLAAAHARPDAGPFAPAGRTMRAYVALPLDAPGLDGLATQALAYVASLPPK
ncbi:TfoX/Sxy family protein [Demequina mangrovi]|uniref:TfoX N-terminal domain-containing protein n=1 Tax=Demequina mangrovi TaxID=1043493 RepID=A0A1H6V5V0_9MICO|nr:TfoX/Sxy family protein [Demequina mangrovi]SEI99898.1 TfoX N-terminal domain-containing protein [Demequina mangrovi]